MNRNTQKFQDEKDKADKKKKKTEFKLDKNHWAAKLRGTSEHLDAIASISTAGSKTLFKIKKAAALAQAAMTLPASVIEAVKNAGGLPFGAFAGVMTLAHGAAQIASIRSQEIDGGGSTPSTSIPSGGDFSVPSLDTEEISPEISDTPPKREVTVHWMADDGDVMPVRSVRYLYDQLFEQQGVTVRKAS